MERHLLNLRRSLRLSSAPADIPLIILRLSWSGVKGNLNQWSRNAVPMERGAADALQHEGMPTAKITGYG